MTTTVMVTRGRPAVGKHVIGLCVACSLPVLVIPARYATKRQVCHDATLAQSLLACVLQRVRPAHEVVPV